MKNTVSRLGSLIFYWEHKKAFIRINRMNAS